MTDTATKKQSTLNTKLPSFWRFVWMFFMQPVSLHYRLKSAGIDPNATGWELVKDKKNKKEIHQYLKYQMILLCVLMPVFVVLMALLLQFLGIEINWRKVVSGVALGVTDEVAVGIAFGVTLGVAVGIAFGVAVGVAEGGVEGVAIGVFVGVFVIVGVADGVADGVAAGVAGGLPFYLAIYAYGLICQKSSCNQLLIL